jgi:ComF family protein
MAVAEFDGSVREAVHALKYENRHAISGLMGRLMAETCRSIGADAVAHVALHRSRRRERGFDQAWMLASHLARSLQIPFHGDAVVRTRKTRQQVGLGPAERRGNVAGAFGAARRVSGQSLLLVDDVYTTGSTLQAAGRALKDAGAEGVTAVVFARAQAGRDGRR